MELHPISFNDHKVLLLMCAGKADSPIKGLSLLRISPPRYEERLHEGLAYSLMWLPCGAFPFNLQGDTRLLSVFTCRASTSLGLKLNFRLGSQGGNTAFSQKKIERHRDKRQTRSGNCE